MDRRWRHLVRLGSSILALGCWGIMFLAGTDVWHDAGRPDFWSLEGPPYPDVRAFVYAFYALMVVLLADLLVSVVGLGRRRTGSH